MLVVLEKQIVRRTSRLIRVRRLMCLLSMVCVLLADGMLLGVEIPLVGAPAIGEKARDAKRFQQLFELQKDGILPPPKDIRQYGATAVINHVPQPPWLRFLPYLERVA